MLGPDPEHGPRYLLRFNGELLSESVRNAGQKLLLVAFLDRFTMRVPPSE
jgi:hypothetical protein